jgi:hypothetical protein
MYSSIFTYAFLVVLIVYLVKVETKDIYRNDETKKSGGGQGKYYYKGKPDKNDSVSDSLDKIEALSFTDENTPKWRRAMICSCFIIILCKLLVFQTDFSVRRFLLLILTMFTVQYIFFNYYTHHYYKYPVTYIRDHITSLRDKLKQKKGAKVNNTDIIEHSI